MSTLEHPRPEGLLPNPGFSQVVAATGTRTIYTAGQVLIDERGALVGAGDLAAQTAQVMRNVGLALAAAGASYADVVKITTYVVNYKPEDRAIVGKAASAFLRERDATSEHSRRRCRAGAAGVVGRDRGHRRRRLSIERGPRAGEAVVARVADEAEFIIGRAFARPVG